MRDLLYLSETKMKDLVPQLPRKVLRRLGVEAGVNVGVLSLRATLSPGEQASQVALLDSVISMIEEERLTRWRTDPELRAGDWIQFEEAFRHETTPPDVAHPMPSGDLVYFNAVEMQNKRFSLCGSREHLTGGNYGLDEVGDAVAVESIAALLGDGRADADSPSGNQRVRRADGVDLLGHARVLTVFDDFVLGTPLYVEYSSTGR